MKVFSKFTNDKCSGVVLTDDEGWVFQVKGRCRPGSAGQTVRYVAAAPPDFRDSRAGSGLPYANRSMAYDVTPNKGEVAVADDGTFEFTIVYPNAYYTNNGSTLVQPHVTFSFGDDAQAQNLKLGPPFVENRSLKHLHGRTRRSHQH
jgi:hypothetical protein